MNTPITTQSSLPGRRRKAVWLALVLALGLLCLAVIPPALSGEASVASSEARIEGSWLVTVTSEPQNGVVVPPFESVVSYTAGGVLIVTDPSVYPMYPMTTAYLGTWTKTGRQDFAFTMIGFQYDNVDDGMPDGLWKLIDKENVTMEPSGDAYNGKATMVMHAPDGSDFSFGVTTHAVRIKAE